MTADDVTYHSVPEIVINRDGPEDRRVAFIDDYGGTMELSTQLLVSDEFWAITDSETPEPRAGRCQRHSAICAWQAGDGALANVALDRLRACR